MAASVKPLFRAIRGAAAADSGAPLFGDPPRDPLDFDPTPPSATEAFLAAEGAAIRAHGLRVWEPAVGAGHIAWVLAARGFEVVGSDVVDRGWPGVILEDFLTVTAARAPVQITNPPYNLVNARDGQGRWLRQALALGADYVALLLNADWPAARKNAFDALFRQHPPSIEYLCCWKIDFRGLGAPPQRNSWFVWDRNRLAPGPDCWLRRRLYRDGPSPDQGDLL